MVARVVIAAPSSGAGKTTVSLGVMAALRARGLRVSPHKVGPDYIDPGYHALATGRPGRNLDSVLVGEELVAPLLLHGAADADIAVIEGVMGLYDGQGATSIGSTAHVAQLLDAPVVLVVDASSMSRSVAALVHGFATYGDVRLAGVILNRVGSDRHEALLREALDVPVLGVLRRAEDVVTPSRHLGLVPAAERAPEALESVERLAELIERCVDLDALVAVARSAPLLTAAAWTPSVATPSNRPVVAIAAGAAFTFSYAETAELLAAAGAEVVSFDPLHDRALPDGTRGLVIGGGFPEVYAERLAANEPLRRQVKGFRGPVSAECAGLLYLCRSLDGRPMAGVLDADARMTPMLTLGYRETQAQTPSWMPDDPVVGHEFHRTVVEGRGAAAWANGEGFVSENVHASYLHLHWAGVPGIAERFVAACA